MEVAESTFEGTNKMIDKSMDALQKLFMAMAQAVEDKCKDPAQRALAKWIRRGGSLAIHHVQGHCLPEVKAELRRQGVPFMVTKNDAVFVRVDDLSIVREINHDILLAGCKYYQQNELRDLEDAVTRFCKGKPEIIALHGLDNNELKVFMNKCNDITKGFTIGTEKEPDGRHTAAARACHTISLVREDRERELKYKKDFCKATLEAMFSLYGPNEEVKKRQLECDKKFEDDVANIKKNCKETKYIVGENDVNHYIELNADSFRFLDRSKNPPLLASFNKDDINFDGELQCALDSLRDKRFVNTPSELWAHLSDENEKRIKSERTKKAMDQIDISNAAKTMVNRIDYMIKNRFIKEKLVTVEGSLLVPVEEIYERYRKEASSIIKSFANGQVDKNYPQTDFDVLNKAAVRFHADPATYKKISDKVLSFTCEVHKARPYTKEQAIKEKINRKEAREAYER